MGLKILEQSAGDDAGGEFLDTDVGGTLACIGQGGDQAVEGDHLDVHGLVSFLWVCEAAPLLPARRRDRGVQVERGFAGNRLHGAEAAWRRRRELGGSHLERRF